MSRRLCSRAPAHRHHVARARAAPGRNGDRPLPRQVLPGDGGLVRHQAAPAGDGAGVDNVAAVLPGARTDVDHVVGRADGLLVVLDHDDGVAQVAQALEGGDQPLVVALVQADGGLVQHVEHAHQAAADLAGQTDALGLATREGAGGAGQRQVVEPDVEQELHALAHLLEDAVGNHVLALAQLQGGHGLDGGPDGEAAQLEDVAPAHRHGQRLGLEAGPPALGAVHLAHEPLDLLAGPVRFGLAVSALQPRHNALEVGLVGPGAVEAVLVGHVDGPVAGAVEDELLVLGLERLPRRLEGEPAELGHPGLQPGEVLTARPGPGRQRALGQGQGVVGHDQFGVDLELGPEAQARRAGAVGRVEGEVARGGLLEADAAVGAGEMLGEGDALVALALVLSRPCPTRSRPGPRPCRPSGRAPSRWTRSGAGGRCCGG